MSEPQRRAIKVGWPPYLEILIAAVHGAGLPLRVRRVAEGVELSYNATDEEERDIRASARPAIEKERQGR